MDPAAPGERHGGLMSRHGSVIIGLFFLIALGLLLALG